MGTKFTPGPWRRSDEPGIEAVNSYTDQSGLRVEDIRIYSGPGIGEIVALTGPILSLSGYKVDIDQPWRGGMKDQSRGDTPRKCHAREMEQMRANAALIAAAPDLYAALERALHWHPNDTASDLVAVAEAALAKARGE